MLVGSKEEFFSRAQSSGIIPSIPAVSGEIRRVIFVESGTCESDIFARVRISHDDPKTELITVESNWPHAIDSSRRTEMIRNILSDIEGRHLEGTFGLIGVEGASVVAMAVAEYLLGEDVRVAFVGVIDPSKVLIDPRKGTVSCDIAPLSLSIDVFETATQDVQLKWSIDTAVFQPMCLHRGFDRQFHAVTDALMKATRACEAAISNTAENGYDPLVTLSSGRGGDQAATIVCFPGAGASVTSMLDFVLQLHPCTTAYGIQPRGLDGRLSPHRSVNTAARFYASALSKSERFRHVPLHFVGHSFGGWLSMDTAAQWVDLGGKVASVTMIDSSAPADAFTTRDSDGAALGRFIRLLEMGVRMELPYADQPTTSSGFREALAQVQKVMAGGSRARVAPDSLVGSYRTFVACIQATGFSARSSAVPTNLVVALGENASDTAASTCGDVLRWKSALPHLNVSACSGDHASILKGVNATRLAAWFEERVLRATAPPINS